jgi:hypothetical protein
VSDSRPLQDRQRHLVTAVLDALPPDSTGALRIQLASARLTGDVPTYPDFVVDEHAPRSPYPDGLLPVEAHAYGPSGQFLGFIMVWLRGGYLGALEFAWVTDDPPTEWPDPSHLQIQIEQAP